MNTTMPIAARKLLPTASAIALVLLLAGCTSQTADVAAVGHDPTHGAKAANDQAPPAAGQKPEPIVKSTALGWTAAVGAPGEELGVVMVASSGNGMELKVPKGAVDIDVSANWTCANVVCTTDFYASAEGSGSGPFGIPIPPSSPTATGDSSVTFSVKDPAAGTWCICAQPHGGSAMMAGTITATIRFA